MRIAVISDTHNLLRPGLLSALSGCGAILHAGDVCQPALLGALREIAPVHAVQGNNDRGWPEPLPAVLCAELAGIRFCMAHRRKDLPAELDAFDLAVYGHTHQYAESRQGRTLLLNPGSCGPRRFHQAATMAFLTVEDGRIGVERLDLAEARADGPGLAGRDAKQLITLVMRDTARGRSPGEIARRIGAEESLVEQIARLYVTHPGVDADGIMTKMGL